MVALDAPASMDLCMNMVWSIPIVYE
ncbi:unnamed protein product [Linum tenue]|uniref:Uncharacterized protein n=1 Tax=Linum tenue TaxID=586396 RepID=A0AAV0KYT1_9ROSI|nr:unnamed protein product [Linum tenue]